MGPPARRWQLVGPEGLAALPAPAGLATTWIAVADERARTADRLATSQQPAGSAGGTGTAFLMAPPVPSGSFSTAYLISMPHLEPSPKYGVKTSAKYEVARTKVCIPAFLAARI